MKRQEVLNKLWDAGIYEDRFMAHKDGSFTYKRSFYYKHGNSSDNIAERITEAIPGAVVLEARDNQRAWPNTSYFVVKFKVAAK